MKEYDIHEVLDFINSNPPPVKEELLRCISNIKWPKYTSKDIDTYSEVLLKISAYVIVAANDDNNKINKEFYLKYFNKIADNVILSGTDKIDSDFSRYYSKYLEYLSDFRD